eukprot:m.205481 g.205481  ORF g.205481 m.205481 type:complete len:200 (-) comp22956_c0_seq1:6-605(-)
MDWLDDVDNVAESEWRKKEADRDFARLERVHVDSGFREAAAATEEAARESAVHDGWVVGARDGVRRGVLLGRVRATLMVLCKKGGTCNSPEASHDTALGELTRIEQQLATAPVIVPPAAGARHVSGQGKESGDASGVGPSTDTRHHDEPRGCGSACACGANGAPTTTNGMDAEAVEALEARINELLIKVRSTRPSVALD